MALLIMLTDFYYAERGVWCVLIYFFVSLTVAERTIGLSSWLRPPSTFLQEISCTSMIYLIVVSPVDLSPNVVPVTSYVSSAHGLGLWLGFWFGILVGTDLCRPSV